MEILKTQLMGTVRLGKMTAEQAKQCLGILKPTVNMEDLQNVDLVSFKLPALVVINIYSNDR